MTRFGKALLKWAICCIGLIVLYLIFGDIGILFAVGLAYVVIAYM